MKTLPISSAGLSTLRVKRPGVRDALSQEPHAGRSAAEAKAAANPKAPRTAAIEGPILHEPHRPDYPGECPCAPQEFATPIASCRVKRMALDPTPGSSPGVGRG